MLHRRNRRVTEPQPAEDERGVSENLYGRHTRLGHVRLTPLFPDEFGRIAGLSDDWTEWERISWEDNRFSHRVFPQYSITLGNALVAIHSSKVSGHGKKS